MSYENKISEEQINWIKGFFGFKFLIAGPVCKILYVLGFVILNIFGLFAIFGSLKYGRQYNYFTGQYSYSYFYFWLSLVGLFITNIFWRLICEGMIIFYNIYERIVEISNKLDK